MLNFGFSEKDLAIVFHQILCMILQEKCFSCYILQTDEILLSNCMYFLRYWEICALQLFINQVF